MKAKINKPCRVNVLSGEVEVSRQEYERLSVLGLIEEKREVPEKEVPEIVTPEKETKKRKAKN